MKEESFKTYSNSIKDSESSQTLSLDSKAQAQTALEDIVPCTFCI